MSSTSYSAICGNRCWEYTIALQAPIGVSNQGPSSSIITPLNDLTGVSLAGAINPASTMCLVYSGCSVVLILHGNFGHRGLDGLTKSLGLLDAVTAYPMPSVPTWRNKDCVALIMVFMAPVGDILCTYLLFSDPQRTI